MRIEKEIQKFYANWSPGVLGFCRLLLGEGWRWSDFGNFCRAIVFEGERHEGWN
jgi:hypothetical protein